MPPLAEQEPGPRRRAGILVLLSGGRRRRQEEEGLLRASAGEAKRTSLGLKGRDESKPRKRNGGILCLSAGAAIAIARPAAAWRSSSSSRVHLLPVGAPCFAGGGWAAATGLLARQGHGPCIGPRTIEAGPIGRPPGPSEEPGKAQIEPHEPQLD